MQMVTIWRAIVVVVLAFALLVALNVNTRMTPMERTVKALKNEQHESRVAIDALAAEVDKLSKAVQAELVRVCSEAASRPVINIEYGTVLNTGGKLIVQSDGMLAVEEPKKK